MATGLETRIEQTSDKSQVVNSSLVPTAQDYRDVFQKQHLVTKSAESIDFGNAPNIYGSESSKSTSRDKTTIQMADKNSNLKIQSAQPKTQIDEKVGAGVSPSFKRS